MGLPILGLPYDYIYVFLALILESPSILLQSIKEGFMFRPLARLPHLLLGTLVASLGWSGMEIAQLLPMPSVWAAEEFTIRATGPLILSLSIDDLETLANTGEVTGDLKLYARFLDEELLANLREILQMRFPLSVATVGHLSYSPLGRDVLTNLGKVFQATPGENGFHGLRAAVIKAAAESGPEGWTALDVMRAFPTSSIEVNLKGLLDLRRELSVYLSYNRAAVQAIRTEAAVEASTSPPVDFARLSDLSRPGPYAFSQRTITVTNPALRQTAAGLTVNYDFSADVYLPERVSAPVPVVIISHGFGAVKEDFIFLSHHLASHGYAVVVPDHVGSDLQYRQQYLNGRLNTLLSPIEFINRPREISYLIDQLEQLVANSPDWAGRLDLNRIAAIGDSLGSSTVMALAGATINYDRLVEACDRDTVMLDFSLYLQCRARFLPPKNYNLEDPRIKAVIAAHNLGGPLYGPEGVGRVTIPIMMVSGNADVVASVVTEQFAPFLWLTSPTRYLALLQVGTHFSSKPPGEGAGDVPSLFMGQHREVGSSYYKTLATAFLGAHLRGDPGFLPYLTAAYAQQLSQGQPMVVDLIQHLTADQVTAAYPGKPPVSLVPPPLGNPIPPREEPILEMIKRTGELRIAMRRDAPPFGYGDETTGWSGYCPNLALALRDHLTETLQAPVAIDLVQIPSTLDNRFDLVRDGQVYLECGPNTIRRDVPGIEFSNVIFATGSHFLTTPEKAPSINPALSLAGVRVGVLANSTNQTLLQERYPEAAVTSFSGPTGRSLAVQSVYRGELDAFLGDDILTISEVLQQGLSAQNLTLVPELPLSCEYYGLALPEDDPQWVATVNRFLAAEGGQQTWNTWLGQYTPYALDTLSYCLNR